MAASSPRKPENPLLWIVAGPNGCGKSTLYGQTGIEGWGGSVWIVNPDLLARRIADHERLAEEPANLAAVRRIEAWLYASIEVHQTIGVETVLSSPKYRALLDPARDRGFEVRMIHVFVDSIERQIERIRLRVLKGGHDVPADRIASRRQRSFEQLAWFIDRVDLTMMFDNSLGRPTLAGLARRGAPVEILKPLPADLQRAIEAR